MGTSVGFRLEDYGYSKIPRNVSISEERLLKSVFKSADEGAKGFLTRPDLKVAVMSLFEYKPSKYEANQILEKFGTIDQDGAYNLTLDQFIEAMAPKLINQDKDDEIRQTFRAFDMQCKGFLTIDDLQKVFGQVTPHMSQHRLESIFRELDRDGDGRVSYKDFDFMMKFDPLN